MGHNLSNSFRPFGFGWSLSLPSIARKTDKCLPKYFDLEDSDVFVLSSAEGLVPLYRRDVDGTWVSGRPGHQRDPADLRIQHALTLEVDSSDDVLKNATTCYGRRAIACRALAAN